MPTRRLLLIAAITLLAGSSSAWGCPFCKEALASNGGDLVSGFFYSILFMLSMPFLIITGMGTYFYLLVRRARAAEAAKAIGQAVDAPGPSRFGGLSQPAQ